MTGAAPRRLPGDPPSAEERARMVRVDHAGEYGAVRIYEGQLAVLARGRGSALVRRMAEQEKRHLEAFDALVAARRVRPTALLPLWHVAGFALGAATALLGERAAMACTVAVEEVIDEHYRDQAARLDTGRLGTVPADPALAAIVREFRADEIAHGEIAREQGAETLPFYSLLSGAIKAGSRLAIWLSTRV